MNRRNGGLDSQYAPLLALLLIALAYLPALRGEFVSDDHSMIEERALLLESPSGARQLVRHTFWWGTNSTGNKQDLWRPWVSLSYWIEYQFGGRSPTLYHVSNYLVHLANCVLLFLLLRGRLGRLRAWLVAALFGVSPAAITSAGWISGRTDLWAFFFSLCFLISYRSAKTTGKLGYTIGGAVSFFMALASKESAVVVPVVAWALDRIPADSDGQTATSGTSRPIYLMWLIPLGVYLILRANVPGGAPTSVLFQALATSLPFLAEQFVRTILNALAPLHYAFFGEQWWSTPGQRGVGFLIAWIVMAALVALVVQGLARRKWWGVGGFWFGISLFPVYAIGQSFAPVADFYAYSAMAGFWVMVIVGLEELCTRFAAAGEQLRRIWHWLLAALVLLFAFLVFMRLPILRSETTLWSHMVKREPHSVRALLGVSEPSFVAGDTTQGLAYLRRALEIEPKNFDVHLRLAAFYVLNDDLLSATPHVDMLAEIAPQSFPAKVWTARYLLAGGRYAESAAAYREAMQLRRPTPDTLFEYGRALLFMNDNETAAQVFQAALEQRPGWVEALGNLGLCYENLGDYPRAVQAYREAAARNPEFAMIWEALVIASLKGGDFDGARVAAQRYFSLNPPAERASQLRQMLGSAGVDSIGF